MRSSPVGPTECASHVPDNGAFRYHPGEPMSTPFRLTAGPAATSRPKGRVGGRRLLAIAAGIAGGLTIQPL
ncbi:uncharacterized protein METZ01_LOCUS67509, partial [marine metagenome]